MRDPAKGFEIDRALASRLRRTPFPYADLADRDALRLTPVRTDAAPELWKAPPNAIVEVKRKGDTVTGVRILEGKAGFQAWVRHGLVLPADAKAKLDAAFAAHDTLDAALAAGWSGAGKAIRSRNTRPVDGGTCHTLYLDLAVPKRGAALDVIVGDDGHIRSHTLHAGQAAWDAFAPYRA